MAAGEAVRLIVKLKGGKEMSGNYHYLGALARLDFARTLPDFEDFEITDPTGALFL